jgi:hypothetical protein
LADANKERVRQDMKRREAERNNEMPEDVKEFLGKLNLL